MEKIYTYDPKKQKQVLVGLMDGDTLFKTVSSRHFMVKENGYGIQEHAIEQLKELWCKKIVLITSTKRKYSSGFNQWLMTVPKDYGHGLQRFLSINRMRVENESKN